MEIFKKLSKIDSRVIYLLISLVVIIPLLFNFPVSITPDKNAKKLYDSLSEILISDIKEGEFNFV